MLSSKPRSPVNFGSGPAAPGLLIAALLLSFPVLADGMRDAGYGDGSLVDSNGDYFYPNGNGTYLDTYGNLYVPEREPAYNPGRFGGYGEPGGGYSDASDPDADGPRYADPGSDPDLGQSSGSVSYDPYTREWSQQTTSRDRTPWDRPMDPDDQTRDLNPGTGTGTGSDTMSNAYMDVGSGYMDADSPTSPPMSAKDPSFPGATATTDEAFSAGPVADQGNPTYSHGQPATDYNPGLASYKRKYFDDDSGQISKGLFEPDRASQFEDAMRARVHEEYIGPGQDLDPLLPFEQGERIRP